MQDQNLSNATLESFKNYNDLNLRFDMMGELLIIF